MNKILVIDDALEVRELIKAMLEGHGHQVITAANGKEALEVARKQKPSLFMIDFLMPDMDGFALFKEIKRDHEFKDIPVIVLTARAKMSDSFMAMGANSFLTKPIKADELFSEVQRLLKQPEQILPQTTHSKRVASDIDLEETDESASKKVLVFGFNKEILEGMAEQLRKENCSVGVIMEERELVAKVDRDEPELLLIQLNGSTMMPIDELIFNLREMIRRKADEFGPVLYNPNVVLYTVADDIVKGEIAENLADTESLLKRCYDAGQAKYIGLYSSITFLFKIKIFLN